MTVRTSRSGRVGCRSHDEDAVHYAPSGQAVQHLLEGHSRPWRISCIAATLQPSRPWVILPNVSSPKRSLP